MKRSESPPPGSGTEAYIRRQSKKDNQRAARKTWLLIGLSVLAILILIFATAPLYAHCTGIDHVSVCVDQRIGGQG